MALSTGHEDVVAEILVRLPPAAVLRSGAVCRAWRRITGSRAFLAAHARRRPLELIIKGPGGALSTIPLATIGDATMHRRHLHLQWCGPGGGGYLGGLLGAYDGGLLLFERASGRDHLICNPVTRQWTLLPRTPSLWIRPCGVYAHAPSGEHRLLYLADDDGNVPGGTRTASHRVLSLGGAAAEARRIGPPAAAIEIYSQLPGPYLSHRGNHHWVRHPWVYGTDRILAFDPVAETFRRIPRPPTRDEDSEGVFLVEAHGSLAVAAILRGSMDLWVLEDYDYDGDDTSRWTRRLRVDLPSPLEWARWVISAGVVLGQQDVILLENGRGVVALYSLTEKKVLKQVKLGRDIEDYGTRSTPFLFRDSLERHAFFDLQGTTS